MTKFLKIKMDRWGIFRIVLMTIYLTGLARESPLMLHVAVNHEVIQKWAMELITIH